MRLLNHLFCRSVLFLLFRRFEEQAVLRSFARPKPETFRMSVAGLDAPVTVRRSPRARRLTLSVNEARRSGVLTMPMHVSLEEASAFLSRHFEWLKDRLEAMPQGVPFADGTVMPLRGLDHRIAFAGRSRGKGSVWIESDASGMDADWSNGTGQPREGLPLIHVAGTAEHAPRRLKDWLIREARKDLTARSHLHARNLGLSPTRITVRDQATRWGSCSSSGVLSYSWRVILAPPFVLDYLAAHEVAHLKEMNHSKRFWALVRQTMPRMEEGRRWLRKHGSALHRYGVEV